MRALREPAEIDAWRRKTRAEQVSRETVERLGDSGVAASGDTGESDPVTAIQDALISFPAERIVLFTHPESDQRYREDLDLEELKERFGVPVEEARVGGG